MISMIGSLAVAASLAVQPGLLRYGAPERLVRVATRRQINLRCGGRGRVTVLLEAGMGYPSYSWRKVQPELERVTRTCSYDRAGLGFSGAGPFPRTTTAMVSDLERLVAAGALHPPFVLVGSSLGGQVVRQYAFAHPHQVAGLVLVDPYVEGQDPAFVRIEPALAEELADADQQESACLKRLRQGLSAREAEAGNCIDAPYAEFPLEVAAVIRKQRMSTADFETTHSELAALTGANEAALRRAHRDLSPRPLIVLMATRQFMSRAQRTALIVEKRRLMASLAALSSRGKVRPIDARHVIQSDRPDAVIDAVRDVLRLTSK